MKNQKKNENPTQNAHKKQQQTNHINSLLSPVSNVCVQFYVKICFVRQLTVSILLDYFLV